MTTAAPSRTNPLPLEDPRLSETRSDNEHPQKDAERRPVDRRDKICLAQDTGANHQSSAKNRGGGLVKPVGENQAIDSEEDPDHNDSESCWKNQISRQIRLSSYKVYPKLSGSRLYA